MKRGSYCGSSDEAGCSSENSSERLQLVSERGQCSRTEMRSSETRAIDSSSVSATATLPPHSWLSLKRVKTEDSTETDSNESPVEINKEGKVCSSSDLTSSGTHFDSGSLIYSSPSQSIAESPAISENSSVLSPQSPAPLPLASAYACLMSRAAAKNCNGNDPASPLVCEDSGYSPPPSPPPPHISEWLNQFNQFPVSDKHTALDRLLSTCNFDQLRYMYTMIEPQFQFDIVTKLPREVSLLIFKNLTAQDLTHCSLVCHSWRVLAEDSLLWREKCEEMDVTEPCVNLQSGSLLSHNPWKAAYIKNHDIDHNWRTMSCFKSWPSHQNHVITCLHLHDNKVICGSDDCSVSIWDINSYYNSADEYFNCDPPKILMGHEGGVWSCEISQDKVVSGSTDRTLKVWNLNTGELIHTLNGHSSTVRCISLHGSMGVSGARDATLHLWDIAQGTKLGVLTGHLAAVRCVCFDGTLIVSGAYDCHVKVWSFHNQSCLYTLEGHSQRVYSLQFDGVYAVSGSLDASIIVWDAQKGKMIHILRGHKSLTSSMVVRNNVLISGNADSTVKVWDIKSGKCLHTLQCGNKHSSAVTGLQFCRNGKYIVSASDDGTVKLWNVVTGHFVRDLLKLETSGCGGVVWRIKCNEEMLICAVGSRNLSEDTKLILFDFRSQRFQCVPSTSPSLLNP